MRKLKIPNIIHSKYQLKNKAKNAEGYLTPDGHLGDSL